MDNDDGRCCEEDEDGEDEVSRTGRRMALMTAFFCNSVSRVKEFKKIFGHKTNFPSSCLPFHVLFC